MSPSFTVLSVAILVSTWIHICHSIRHHDYTTASAADMYGDVALFLLPLCTDFAFSKVAEHSRRAQYARQDAS